MAERFQADLIKWLDEQETVDGRELSAAFGIVVGSFFNSMPVEIRSHVVRDFTEQLEKTYKDKDEDDDYIN